MTESVRNTLVGLFVVASLAVLGVLMVWFGETPSWLSRGEWTLQIRGVHELSGIGEGSPVNLNGVGIGRVTRLGFEDSRKPQEGVVIYTRIRREFSVPAGAKAKVYGATFGLGMGHVDLVMTSRAPTQPLPKDGSAVLRGEMHSTIREVISQEFIDSVQTTIVRIGDLAKAATPVADNLSNLLEQRSVEEVQRPGAAEKGFMPNLSTVMERLDHLIAHVNAVLGDEHVQEDVKVAVRDVKEATEDLKTTIALWKKESERTSENLNQGIDSVEEHVDRSFVKINEVLDRLDEAAKGLAVVMREVAEGRGTAGLITHDERLYEAAVITFDRLQELIGTLQRIASKIERDGYITLGKVTPVGVITKDFPIGPPAQASSDAR